MDFDGFATIREGYIRDSKTGTYRKVKIGFPLPCLATEEDDRRMAGSCGSVYVDTRFLPPSYIAGFDIPRKVYARVILKSWAHVELHERLPVLTQLFWWPGSKARIMGKVWPRLGYDIRRFIDPFTGSGAPLLTVPILPPYNLLNDFNGQLINALRAMRAGNSIELARLCVRPSWECDVHAAHVSLRNPGFNLGPLLDAKEAFFDLELAAKFLWVEANRFGDPAGTPGPWYKGTNAEGFEVLVKGEPSAEGICRDGIRIDSGTGVSRQHPDVATSGRGVFAPRHGIDENARVKSSAAEFEAIANRFYGVSILCGDWKRPLSPSTLSRWTPCAVYLDPPYGGARKMTYPGETKEDKTKVAADVLQWCKDHGRDPHLRIAVSGWHENDVLANHGWDCLSWKGRLGFAAFAKGETVAKQHAAMERIWFSLHCLPPIYR